MPNRKLSSDEIQQAKSLLDLVRQQLSELAGGDGELLFAHRRRLIVRLTHDERGTPAERNKLKALKRKEQGGLCPMCGEELPLKYAELDRRVASGGYTLKTPA